MTDSIKLIGNVASPYTRKMIAYLRYKRIPYEVIWGQPEDVLKKMNIEPQNLFFCQYLYWIEMVKLLQLRLNSSYKRV